MNNKMRRVKIDPKNDFDEYVFGADSFRRYWPALETDEGVIVRKFGPDGWWYIWAAHDSAFFTDEDMEYLIIL